MPYLNLITNIKIDDEKAFALEFAKVSAEILGKPLAYISTSVTYNPTLNFAGSFDSAIQLTVTSLENLSPNENEGHSKALYEFLEKKLGVKNDRGYISFIDPGRGNIGFKGTTVATFLK